MFMISVLSVCCCALLNFESFVHGNLFKFFYKYNMFLFCCFLLLFFVLFCLFGWLVGLLVALDGIKKYLA